MADSEAAHSERNAQANRWIGPAVALLFALLAASPLLLNTGFLNTRGGGDSPFLLFRLHQLLAALRQGVFPVRWMPDAALGLGYPFFNYYAALPFYFAAALKAFGFSYVLSLKLTQFAGFAVAAWGMYAWMHEAGYARPAAVLATAAYTFAPFHLVNVYVRGDSLSELWAFAWYPLILLTVLRLARHPSLRRALPFGLAYAGLLLTHNISALIFTPFLLLYLIVLLLQSLIPRPSSRLPGAPAARDAPSVTLRSTLSEASRRHPSPAAHSALFIVHCSLSIALAFALSAFFWLPALMEGKYGQLASVTQGYFNYTQHFRGLSLVQPSLLFNYDVGSAGTTPFAMGLVQSVLVVCGLIALARGALRRRSIAAHDIFALAGLIVATFMITPLSRRLWDSLPLLPYVQFPWRFLSIQSLFAAMVVSGLASFAADDERLTMARADRDTRHPSPATRHPSLVTRHPSLVTFVVSALLALTSLPSLRLDFIRVDDADVTAQRLQLYEYFTGNIGTTIRNEYLPKWTVPRPYTSDDLLLREPRLKVLAGSGSGTRIEKRATSQRWKIKIDSPQAVVAVPLLYWPGWTVAVDGKDVRVAAAPGLGWIAFAVPQGEHTVALRLGHTALRALAELISLLAWLGLAFYVVRLLRQSPTPRGRFAVSNYRTPIALFIVALLIVSLLLHLAPRPAPSITQLSADFDQLAYFNSAPIRFGDSATLVGYDYSADRLARGETLRITSVWETQPAPVSYQASLELVSPSAPLQNDPTVLTAARFAPATAAVASLTVPATIPPGVYLLRVKLSDEDQPIPALAPTGGSRGAVYLRPIWVDDPGPPPPGSSLADFGLPLRLAALTATQLTTDTLSIGATWQALTDVPQNYALALRLRDSAGNEWAALDTQLARGFYPTSLWRPGEVVPDSFSLPVPRGAPPGEYQLSLALYDVSTLAPIGEYAQPARLTLATAASANDVRFHLTDALGLERVDVPPSIFQGEPLAITARWVTLAALPAGLQARWSLIDAAGANAHTQLFPLSTAGAPEIWPAGSLILGRASLTPPPTLAPGKYVVALSLLGSDGSALATMNNLGVVEVVERNRPTEIPAGARQLKATFGDSLALRAYDLKYESQTLTLTPYWSALARPAGSYKYFVHVFDPLTEAIVAQADDFPRGGAYPTAQWAAGEVVPDTIRISLASVAGGSYRIAVGWYDPSDPQARLAAKDENGSPLDQNRVVLPDEIQAP
ncbi:MAG: hypothetical protein HY023_02285 [Chloroflexi bacterium]|nr:hypothetical protein [Chloroflexota bacterium]